MPVENSPAGARGFVLVLGAVACVVLGAVAAVLGLHFWHSGQDTRGKFATTTYVQDWQLICPPMTEKANGCALQQAIIQRNPRATIAALTVVRGVAADRLQIVVPLGVLIGPGLAVSVGNSATVAVPYTTCSQSDCIGITTLTPKLLDQMENGGGGQITLVGRDGRPVALPFSLKGFADAVHERDEDWRRRTDHWF